MITVAQAIEIRRNLQEQIVDIDRFIEASKAIEHIAGRRATTAGKRIVRRTKNNGIIDNNKLFIATTALIAKSGPVTSDQIATELKRLKISKTPNIRSIGQRLFHSGKFEQGEDHHWIAIKSKKSVVR